MSSTRTDFSRGGPYFTVKILVWETKISRTKIPVTGRDIAVKMAEWSSEEFQKVSEVSCEYLSDSFSFALLCSHAMSLCFRLRSPAQSHSTAPAPFRLSHDLFHTSIASWSDQYLVVPAPFRLSHAHNLSIASWLHQYHVATLQRDHSNHAHAIKVWQYICIHTNAN